MLSLETLLPEEAAVVHFALLDLASDNDRVSLDCLDLVSECKRIMDESVEVEDGEESVAGS